MTRIQSIIHANVNTKKTRSQLHNPAEIDYFACLPTVTSCRYLIFMHWEFKNEKLINYPGIFRRMRRLLPYAEALLSTDVSVYRLCLFAPEF